MTPTERLNAYRVRFPEHAKTPNDVIAARIADAVEECSEAAYGVLFERAVRLHAARNIALSPYGQGARLPNGGTTYDAEFYGLQEIAGLGPRTT